MKYLIFFAAVLAHGQQSYLSNAEVLPGAVVYGAGGLKVTTTATVVTLSKGNLDINATGTQIATSATITKNSGTDTGTFYLYVDYNSGTPVRKCIYGSGISIGNYTVSSGFSGSTCASGSAFPSGLGIFPRATVAIASGSFSLTPTDYRPDIQRSIYSFTGGCTETSPGVVDCSSASGFDPMDMTKDTFTEWIIKSDFYPIGFTSYDGAAACSGSGIATSTRLDASINSLQTGTSTNNYCVHYMADRDSGTAGRFGDRVSSSNFQPFTYKVRARPTATTSVRLRLGCFVDRTADPQGLYLEYDSSVSANWRIVVNDGSATATDTTVAASTTMATLVVSASATGTLSGSVNGSTPVTAVDTFPACTFWGLHIKTLTTAAKVYEWSWPRIQFTGLSR